MESVTEANLRGNHSVALALLRQCVEAISIVELAILDDESTAQPLLEEWRSDSLTLGGLRQEMERRVWPKYGPGLGTDTWSAFFARVARAVQPYSHCSYGLLNWQFRNVSHQRGPDGGLTALVALGGYDGVKASRITLLQAILVWTLVSLVLNNSPSDDVRHRFEDSVAELGREVMASDFFMQDSEWEVQFYPHHIFAVPPKGDGRVLLRSNDE